MPLFRKKATPLSVFVKSLSSIPTSFGHISIETSKDTATIKFIGTNDNATQATLRVYNRANLNLLEAFKQSKNNDTAESFWHTWKTRRHANTIIVYSDELDTAMVLTSEADAYTDLQRILAHPNIGLYKNVAYLNEHYVDTFLREYTETSANKLSEVQRMDDAHIQLIHKYPDLVKVLLKNGINLLQLAYVDIALLEKKLELSNGLEIALKYISPEQALAIFHAPPAAPKSSAFDTIEKVAPAQYTLGGYDGQISEAGITLTHKESQTKLIISYEKPGLLSKPNLKDSAKIDMGYTWHILADGSVNSKDHFVRKFYCPELNLLQVETVDKGFPEKEVKPGGNERYQGMLASSPYYKGTALLRLLSRRDTSVVALREKGISSKKLIVMLHNQAALDKLLDLNMTFDDFAHADLNRMAHIMFHFDEAEKFALPLIDNNPQELFGLNSGMYLENINKDPEKSNTAKHWAKAIAAGSESSATSPPRPS